MKTFYFLIVIILFCSCTVKVSPIEYGTDNCDFCQMGIVDNKHASQLVTEKGKNFKFDAIECMISYINENQKKQSYSHILVSDIQKPGELISANNAYFIVSQNIPSPMGAFLSATKTKQDAESITTKHSGKVFSYQEILHQNMKY
jgi:copper chaperone NosL